VFLFAYLAQWPNVANQIDLGSRLKLAVLAVPVYFCAALIYPAKLLLLMVWSAALFVIWRLLFFRGYASASHCHTQVSSNDRLHTMHYTIVAIVLAVLSTAAHAQSEPSSPPDGTVRSYIRQLHSSYVIERLQRCAAVDLSSPADYKRTSDEFSVRAEQALERVEKTRSADLDIAVPSPRFAIIEALHNISASEPLTPERMDRCRAYEANVRGASVVEIQSWFEGSATSLVRSLRAGPR
jgi:hypothetical protein